MQGGIHQRDWYVEISDFEFGGLERGIAVLGAEMAGDRHPDIFAGNFGQKLAVHDVPVEAYLLILNRRCPAAELCIGGKPRRPRWTRAHRFCTHRAELVGAERY